MNKKICHLTSVHKRNDVRIFEKECKSLSYAGFKVSLIVADGLGDEICDNINIHDVGKQKNRFQRFLITPKEIYKKAKLINADIYHFHDPELILVGLKLIKSNKKVIYDIHEDVPRQILSKPYLNKISKKIISIIFEKFENKKTKKFSGLICATPYIRDRFLKINKNSFDINNFPKTEEFVNITQSWKNRLNEICYIGSISEVRGIREIVKSLEFLDLKLHLAGEFVNRELENEIKKEKGWEKVFFYGFVNREKISEILSKVKIGLVTLHPTNSYKNAYPVKMFEYMAAGVPVLASDFKLYSQILNDAQCGRVANPLDPFEISEVIKKMLADDKELQVMSVNGTKAVFEKYNWKIEELKLLNIYNNL